MPASGLVPTLSQVQTDMGHRAPDRGGLPVDQHGDCVGGRVHPPVGTDALPRCSPWEREAAEAAQHQAYTDRLMVMGLADQLHDASVIARAGAREIDAAKQTEKSSLTVKP